MVLNLNLALVSCLRLQFAVAHPDRQKSKNLSAAIQAHGRQPSGKRSSCSLGSVQLMPSFASYVIPQMECLSCITPIVLVHGRSLHSFLSALHFVYYS